MSEDQVRFWVRDELRKIIEKGLMYSAEAKPQPKPQKMTATQIAEKFPEDLRQHLTINDDRITTEFVSNNKWQQMNAIAKELGYKYISAGKESHWRRK